MSDPWRAPDRLPEMARLPEAARSPTQSNRALRWSRDLARVGLCSGLLAPLVMVLFDAVAPAVLLASGACGAAAGAALGGGSCWLIQWIAGRISVLQLWVLLLPIGGLWGAVAGVAAAVASQISGVEGVGGGLLLWPAVAFVAGVVQLSACWLPYALLDGADRPTRVVVDLACLWSVLLGPVAIVLSGLLVALLGGLFALLGP